MVQKREARFRENRGMASDWNFEEENVIGRQVGLS